jgi:hypothetical protein
MATENEIIEGVEHAAMVMPETDMGDGEGVMNEVGDEPVVEKPVQIRIGDIFAYRNNAIGFTVLDITDNTPVGRVMKVRMYATIGDFFFTSEADLREYIAEYDLYKVTTRRDQIEEIAEAIVYKEGDLFTVNGVPFIEILTDEMRSIDSLGKSTYVVGIRDNNGVEAFRSVVEVTHLIYGNTDQFPAA